MRQRPEGNFNDDIRTALAGLDPCRVENSVGPGTPDINFSRGWIESKSIQSLPKRDKTVVALAHYVSAQRAWHVKRRMAGGVVFVALRVQATREVFVLDALEAAQHLGTSWTSADLKRKSPLWLTRWDATAFRDFIIRSSL